MVRGLEPVEYGDEILKLAMFWDEAIWPVARMNQWFEGA